MAKRHDSKDTKQKNPFLPDPDEYYFDDDLDSVTRNLPTEEEYLPKEEEPPVEEEITEGTNRIGVRMIGLKPTAEDIAREESAFTPAYDADEDEEDLTVPRRAARSVPEVEIPLEDTPDDAAPVLRTRTKKQQRLLQQEKENKPKGKLLRVIAMSAVTVVLLLVIGMMLLSRTMMPDMKLLQVPEQAVSGALGPVQGFFGGIVESVADYFRQVKLRENLEQAYNELLAENEELYYLSSMALDLQERLAQYEDIAEEIDRKITTEKMLVYVEKLLSPRERQIIMMRYGLGGIKAQTQREIAQSLGISRSYVSRIEKAALTTLRDALK